MDPLSPPERSARMRLIRSRDTKPEMAVRSLVHQMGYRFRLQGKMPGKPDLVFRGRSRVIFVHGCFWHLHRGCKRNRPPGSRRRYWGPKLEGNAERDKRMRTRLRRMGWRSLVVWECELRNPERAEAKIRAFLGPRESSI